MTEGTLRPEIPWTVIERVFVDIRYNLDARIKQHGPGAYVGTSEALGVITKEYHELIWAEHERDPRKVYEEASDILVGCLWLMATMRMKGAVS